MKTVVTNMCMIYDEESGRVLVLDKKKKYGWEGLTFPGGHVEEGESFEDACKREVFEESNLKVKNLEFKGFIQWIIRDRKERQLGLLYRTTNFKGSLISDNVEGRLFWMDLDEFMGKEGKSQSMDDCLKIYLGECSEVVRYYEGERHLWTEYF